MSAPASPVRRFGQTAIATPANYVTIARLVLTVEENPFFGDPDASPRVREVKRRLLSLRKLCIYVDRECGQIESIFPPDEGG